MVTSHDGSRDPLPGDRPGPNHTFSDEDCRTVTTEDIDQAEAALAPDVAGQESSSTERLAVDEHMVQAILDEGLGRRRHKYLETELIKYAAPVLKYLIYSRRIAIKCHRFGRTIDESFDLQTFNSYDVDDFIQEMMTNELPLFTKAVFVDRRWSPSGGASLKTYFVNGCVLQFPDIFRKWRRGQKRYPAWGLSPDLGPPPRAPDPATSVANSDQVIRLLDKIPDQPLREVLVRRAVGYPAGEAAAQAGLSTKAAESRLSRLRRNLAQDAGELETQGKNRGGRCSNDTREA